VLQDLETSGLHHDFGRPVHNKLQRVYHRPGYIDSLVLNHIAIVRNRSIVTMSL
jgi:hypothetical protein